LLDKLYDPVILPSGKSVNRSVMQSLIDKMCYDPFNQTKLCKRIQPNLFLKNAIEILDEVSKERDDLEIKGFRNNQDTQFNINTNEVTNIAKINEKKEEVKKVSQEVDQIQKDIKQILPKPVKNISFKSININKKFKEYLKLSNQANKKMCNILPAEMSKKHSIKQTQTSANDEAQ